MTNSNDTGWERKFIEAYDKSPAFNDEGAKKQLLDLFQKELHASYERGVEEGRNEKAVDAYKAGCIVTLEDMQKNIGMLRQWLNEDRIREPAKLVTNEEIAVFLLPLTDKKE